MTEGIVAAYRFRNLDGGPRVQAIQNHGWIQGAATVSVALGFLAIWRNKAAKGKPHFTSLHGKVRGAVGGAPAAGRAGAADGWLLKQGALMYTAE